MASFDVLLSATARKQLRDLPGDRRQKIVAALRRLSDDPFTSRSGADVRKLWQEGDLPFFRLRVGDYRVLYFVVGREVRVTRVAHRSVAYRGLD